MKFRVNILDECDGFILELVNEDDILVKSYRFDQEDTREGLVSFFSDLGIESQYEEVY